MLDYNELMGNRSTVLADCELIRQTLCDTAALATEMQQEQDEMTVVSELMQAHIKKNASVAQSQEAYALEAGRIENRYNAAFEHYTALDVNVNEYLSQVLANIRATFANEYLSHLTDLC